jgi:hypothetical protein
MATDRSYYWLDLRFERRVVFLACTSPKFWARLGHEIEAENLNAEEARWAMRAARMIVAETHRPPDSFVLVLQRLRTLMDDGKVSYAEVEAVGDYFIAGAEDSIAYDAVVDQLAPVLAKRLRNKVVLAVMQEAAQPDGEEGPFPEARKLVERAAAVGRDAEVTDVGVVLGEGSYDAIKAVRGLVRLGTGIEDLDAQLNGGPRRGGFTIWMGSTGAGKSLSLTHTTSHALRHQKVVAFATLELPLDQQFSRLKANLTGFQIDDVQDDPDCTRGWFAVNGGGLGRAYLQAFPSHATTVADLRKWVDEVELREGACRGLAEGTRHSIDLLVIDYGDLLAVPSSVGKDADHGYSVGKHVFGELRDYAEGQKQPGDKGHPGGPIWVSTACAATRGTASAKRKYLSSDDIADSIHKSRRATLMISINPRDDGTEYWVAKNTHGKDLFPVGPIFGEREKGRIAPLYSV